MNEPGAAAIVAFLQWLTVNWMSQKWAQQVV
jgi:hypothetical protein